ncbi:MAG: thymidylate synthase, partial [Firmicutes bacterium]|nr:thymidylate synthase [Bacillota bacterium]
LSEMGLEPCAYSMTFNVTGNKLNAILNQRSQDILVANNWNVFQYAILTMMFAQVSGLEPGEFVHMIADAHIYDRHVPIVKEMIERPTFPAPKVTLNPEIKNFYDFTVDDVIVENYQANPQIKGIPVAV